MTNAPALVLSLDFELGWGNMERLSRDPVFREAVLRARAVVPQLLELFDEFEVSATWAIVGMLFGDDRGEWRRAEPRTGRAPSGPTPPGVGIEERWDEEADPSRLAPSLIRQILRSGRHEIATHTFSHVFALEDEMTPDALRVQLRAARAVAEWWHIPLESIVFPRNQYDPRFDGVLGEEGIRTVRGNPRSWMWRFEDAASGARLAKRAARLLDAYLPFLPSRIVPWDSVMQAGGIADVRASFFLRPYSPRLGILESLRLRRLTRALQLAARDSALLHLWWHPHNFSRYPERNLDFLRSVLEEFARLRDARGMRSMTMAQVAAVARTDPGLVRSEFP